MVLEVLSHSSEEKDTVILMRGYREAEVREYWLIDARKTPLVFEVYRHGARGYIRTRKLGGWVKSEVFGKSFRLTAERGPQGDPDYTLDMR
jgi:Uma2 family endonuclease